MNKFKKLGLILVASLSLAMVIPTTLLPVSPITVEAATVKINKKSLTLEVGNSHTLKIIGTKQKVKWASSNKSVATISNKGKVIAKSHGKATITAIVNSKKYTCKVTIKKPLDKVIDVTVTNMLSIDELSEYLSKVEFSNIVTNDDYTTTYTMTTTQQKEILKYLFELWNNSAIRELPKYYQSITTNEHMSEFKIVVDKEEFMKNKHDDLTLLGIFIYSMAYQQFSAIQDQDIKFNVSYIDNKTMKEFDKTDVSDLR